MAFKQFLQNLFERVGLAESPALPPQAADIPVADPQHLGSIFARLAAWGVKQVTLVAEGEPDAGDLVRAAREVGQRGMRIGVRGLAGSFQERLLADLAAAGVSRFEIPFLSAFADVHDALAGAGDHRHALRVMEKLAELKIARAAQIVLVPSTWKTIERTLQFLDDRGMRDVRWFAIACRDDEPSSWAISASELVSAASWIEQQNKSEFNFAWHPPQVFAASRTLAQQVRRGPRAAAHAVRIEVDGSVLPPVGPEVSGGNMLQSDWKQIARSEVFRALKRRREAAARCADCPGLAACEQGCLRDAVNWAEG
jgi:radical SAM protein with 4Fe4S-binding SPASM domain